MGGCMLSKNATAPAPADEFSSGENIKNRGFSFWKNMKDRHRKMIRVCFNTQNVYRQLYMYIVYLLSRRRKTLIPNSPLMGQLGSRGWQLQSRRGHTLHVSVSGML